MLRSKGRWSCANVCKHLAIPALASCRLYLETAKRDGEAQSQEVVQLREKAAVLEAQCLDAAKALEAAQAKVQMHHLVALQTSIYSYLL